MNSSTENVFRSARHAVNFSRAERPSNLLGFTFTEFGNRDLEHPGFATTFLNKNSVDVVAIKTSADNWYQDTPDELFQAIDDIVVRRELIDRRRFTYGSSMGGYAAIKFARRLRADSVFAISPQFDVSSSWDTRWSNKLSSGTMFQTLTTDDIQPNCSYTIAYDPKDKDCLHFHKYASIIPEQALTGLQVLFGGHPAGGFLNPAGILSSIVFTVANGRTVPGIRPALKGGRSAFPKYFFNLASACIQHHKYNWASSIIKRALLAAPTNPDYNIKAAEIADRNNDSLNALCYASLAAALSPLHPHVLGFLGALLKKNKLLSQALHYTERALSIRPADPGFLRQRDDILKDQLAKQL